VVPVLIVDDIQFERRRIGEAVKREGLAFAEAGNGAEALELVEQLKPRLILTDLVMPVMDGLELLRELRRRFIDIPTVVITSDAQEETRRECLGLGASDVLGKPWEECELAPIIRSVARGRAEGTG
jgi:CheY-like chemotaxis protein